MALSREHGQLCTMLMFKLLTILVAAISIHPILVLCAEGPMQDLSAYDLYSQSFNLETTISYLDAAIEQNDYKTVKAIIQYLDENSVFGELIKNIYYMDSPAVPGSQLTESDELKISKLVSAETISAIDLGYLIGFKELIKLLIVWKLKQPNGPIKSPSENKTEILEALLESVLDINVKNSHGNILLHVACQLNKFKIVKLILARSEKYGTKAMVNTLSGDDGQLFEDVVYNDTLDINCRNNVRKTPLHYACESGNPGLVSLLLDVPQCKINARDSSKATPLIMASSWGNLDVVKLLLSKEKLDLNATTRAGVSALHAACELGHLEIVKLLCSNPELNVNQKSIQGNTPILTAATWVAWKIVNVLLFRKDLDLNAINNDGDTILHIACRQGQLGIVRKLAAKPNMDKTLKNKHGNTAIMEAMKKRYLKIVTVLCPSDN